MNARDRIKPGDRVRLDGSKCWPGLAVTVVEIQTWPGLPETLRVGVAPDGGRALAWFDVRDVTPLSNGEEQEKTR